MDLHPNPFAPFIPSYSPAWQRWLRYSVRLYLALGERGVNKRLVETCLRLIENKLLRHILRMHPPTPAATAQARAILEQEQAALLASPFEVSELLHRSPVASADESAMPLQLDEAQEP